MSAPPKESLAVVALVLLIGVIAISGIVHEYRACAAKGGTLVRGLVWLECIETPPPRGH